MTTQQQLDTIKANSSSQQDFNNNLKCFETFGHLFQYNVLACLSQTYCINNQKPALNADAMVGIVRGWIDPTTGKKICALMKSEVLTPEYDEQGNVNPHTVGVRYAAMRSDELAVAKEYGLDLPIHTWTFTMHDAKLRGNANKRTWVQMPLVMCAKRAATALCRLVFPDVIGTACSPDELAEMMLTDEDEIERIAYAANGERIPHDLKKKTKHVVSHVPSNPPRPQSAPESAPKANTFHIRDFNSIQTITNELTKEGVDLDDALQALEVYGDGVKLTDMTETHFRRLFYPVAFSPFRIILKEGRLKDWTQESLKDVDCDSLAAMFDAFYGTTAAADQSNVEYCEMIIRCTQSPVFSEIARYMQKLLSKDLIDEKTQRTYLKVITQSENMFNFDLYDEIMNTLPSMG